MLQPTYEKASIDDIKKVLKYLSKGYEVPKIIYDTLFNIAVTEVENKKRVVLIKRDPNVFRGRIQGAYVKVIDDETMEIHPACVEQFGADFDGDQMGIIAPLSDEAQQEIRDKMITVTSNSNMYSPNFKLSKEMLIGLFTLTFLNTKEPIKKYVPNMDIESLHIGTPISYVPPGTNKAIETTAGRIILNSALPSYVPFVNDATDGKFLTKLLSKIIRKNKTDFRITIDKLTKMGFKYATMYPQTISLDMFILPKEFEKYKIELSKEKNISKQQGLINEMQKKLAEYIKNNVPELYIQMASGAAKDINQIRQIMLVKGLTANASNEILPPITKSLNEGYTSEQYFDASAGARKGLIDRAINTRDGGYAYRKMVYVLGNAEADITNPDCGTKRTLKIKLTNELYNRMSGRYILEKGKSVPISDKYIGQYVQLRSPIFCKSRAICRMCYGDLIYQVNSKNVGIIAAQECASLSEKIMKCSYGLVEVNGELVAFDDLWESIPE